MSCVQEYLLILGEKVMTISKLNPENLGPDCVIGTDHLDDHGAPDGLSVDGRDVVAYGCRISNENPYGRTVGGPTFFTSGGGVGCFHS